MENITDLIKRAQAGDRQAFGTLYALLRPTLRKSMNKKLAWGEQPDCAVIQHPGTDDIVNQAFLSAWERIDQYNPKRGKFITWLIGIAKNARADSLRAINSQEGVSHRAWGRNWERRRFKPIDIDPLSYRGTEALREFDDDNEHNEEFKYLYDENGERKQRKLEDEPYYPWEMTEDDVPHPEGWFDESDLEKPFARSPINFAYNENGDQYEPDDDPGENDGLWHERGKSPKQWKAIGAPLPSAEDEIIGAEDEAEEERRGKAAMLLIERCLPEDVSEIVYRSVIEGMSLADLSTQTGIGLNTLKAKLYRGLAKIGRHLGENWDTKQVTKYLQEGRNFYNI